MAKYLDFDGVLYLWQKIKAVFVVKENGKGLSEANYTEAEKNKLAGIDMSLYVKTSDKGQPGGVAALDGAGLIPSAQLPSYVDDVIEGYYNASDGKFYTTEEYTVPIPGETGKIYVDLVTNNSYRYGGTVFVLITSSDMTPITNAEIDEIAGG